MKKRTIRLVSMCLALAIMLSVAAFAATSGTKNSVYAKISAKSATNGEQVDLYVSRSDATKVQGTIGVYTSGGSLVTSFTPQLSNSSSATFSFTVSWSSISTGYYAQGATSAYVSKWVSGYTPSVSLA